MGPVSALARADGVGRKLRGAVVRAPQIRQVVWFVCYLVSTTFFLSLWVWVLTSTK
jgi:hypothetical protein